jgi:pyridoxine 5-phosphate synthase
MGVSAFIDPDPKQIEACDAAEFDYCEIHTGPYAQVFHEGHGDLHRSAVKAAIERIAAGGERIVEAGMQFNAGHGLNYDNVRAIAALPELRELHIGHAIVSRAVFVGMREAVREMKRLIEMTGEYVST